MGGDPIILGALDRRLIDEVIKRHINQVRYCYQRELAKNPALGGKIVVKFTIAPDGSVRQANVKSSSMNSAPVQNCIVGRFMRMQFPEPKGGGIVIVSYPFLFSPREGGGLRLGQLPWHQATPVRQFPVPDYRSDRHPARRTDFRSTVMWAPSVSTGDDGKAEVRFALSDAVTTFKVVAQGIGGAAGAAEAGRVEHELHSTLPFAIDVPIPGEVSFGDRLLLPARLTNRRGVPLEATIAADIGAPLQIEDGTHEQHIALDAMGSETTVIALTVPDGRASAEVVVRADGGGLTDAVRKRIDIVPRGFPDAFSASGELSEKASHRLQIDEALPGSIDAALTVYPNTLTTLLDGMEDMVRIPGGCFEQTSSSNYPNVLILDRLDQTGRAPRLAVDRTEALRTGYAKLTGYQVGSGGFETFGNGPGKQVLSAYGLLQFADMARVWPAVDRAMIARDLTFLHASRDGEGGYDSVGASSHNYGGAPAEVNDAFITWALVSADPDSRSSLGAEIARTASLAKRTRDPYLLALATLTLQSVDPTAAAVAAGRLAGLQGEDGSFPGVAVTVVGSRGAYAVVESTALSTLALLGTGGHRGAIAEAVRWLGEHRTATGWGSTQATVLALKALNAAEAARGDVPGDGSLAVYANGVLVGTLEWDGNEQHPATIDLSKALAEGENALEIHHRGAPIPYAVEASWTTDLPADAPNAPLAIDTRLSSRALSLGEPVRLTVTAANATDEAVASPIARVRLPAGVRAETRALSALVDRGQIAFFSTADREVTLYWEGFAPNASHEIAIDLVPEIPGTFIAPPSSIYPYYDGDQIAWAAGGRVVIAP